MKSFWKEAVAAGIGGLLTAILIATVPSAFKWLVNPAVPRGAVLAFNLDACPFGWSEFKEGGGRFIVGAGDHPNAPIQVYKLGATGGQEKVGLTLEEMPKHSHSYSYLGSRPGGCGLEGCGWEQALVNAETSEKGAGKPHDNLPPYVALTYCVRN
jgi:hypothetical protein